MPRDVASQPLEHRRRPRSTARRSSRAARCRGRRRRGARARGRRRPGRSAAAGCVQPVGGALSTLHSKPATSALSAWKVIGRVRARSRRRTARRRRRARGAVPSTVQSRVVAGPGGEPSTMVAHLEVVRPVDEGGEACGDVHGVSAAPPSRRTRSGRRAAWPSAPRTRGARRARPRPPGRPDRRRPPPPRAGVEVWLPAPLASSWTLALKVDGVRARREGDRQREPGGRDEHAVGVKSKPAGPVRSRQRADQLRGRTARR